MMPLVFHVVDHSTLNTVPSAVQQGLVLNPLCIFPALYSRALFLIHSVYSQRCTAGPCSLSTLYIPSAVQ